MEEYKTVKKFSDYKLGVIKNDAVEAVYDMNLNQLKLFIALVTLINKDDTEFKEYKIEAKSLTSILNISKTDDTYKVVDRITDGLMQKYLAIKDAEKKEFIKYSIFSMIEYKDGILTVCFNDKMKPFLLNLKENFTKFKLSEIKPFASKYSIRIYQLLKQYQNIGERTFEIEDLREMLGLQKELQNFDSFRRFVLKIAQKELENTPMAFDFVPIKRGRGGKVVEVKLILKKKQAILTSEPTPQEPQQIQQDNQVQKPQFEINDETINQLKQIYSLIPKEYKNNTLDKLIMQYINSKGYLYTKQNVEYVVSQKNVKNFMIYLQKALEGDWGGAGASEIEIRIKQEEAKTILKTIKDAKFFRKNRIYTVINFIYDQLDNVYKLEATYINENNEEHKTVFTTERLKAFEYFEWLDTDSLGDLTKLF